MNAVTIHWRPRAAQTLSKAGDDEKTQRRAKRKQLLSSHDSSMRKRCRHPLQESSYPERRPLSKPRRQYLKSHYTLDQCSKVAISLNAKDRLPSPAPSIPPSISTEMSPGNSNLSPVSKATPPMLTEITFRPHSAHCYSLRRQSGTVVTDMESLSPS